MFVRCLLACLLAMSTVCVVFRGLAAETPSRLKLRDCSRLALDRRNLVLRKDCLPVQRRRDLGIELPVFEHVLQYNLGDLYCGFG